jgi:glycosyltransferase involved in cell wall biosynthesis
LLLREKIIKISAIIPTFNRAEVLPRAIDSIINQTISCHEIIVIDDGSTDKTFEILKEYIENKQIVYKKTENKGVSAARNDAIKLASGDWISFLDSDDEWLPIKNEKQLEILKLENTNLIHGEEIWIRNGKRVNPKFKHKKTGGMIFEKCLPLCLISPSATMIKKSILQEFGGFDESFIVCEDYDLWLKITLRNPVSFVETPVINKYGGHEDQLSMKFKAMDYYRIKSMQRILITELLSAKQQELIKKEIICKGEILLNGYQKHNNMQNYKEVEAWMSKCK